jgi:hypothetical protein
MRREYKAHQRSAGRHSERRTPPHCPSYPPSLSNRYSSVYFALRQPLSLALPPSASCHQQFTPIHAAYGHFTQIINLQYEQENTMYSVHYSNFCIVSIFTPYFTLISFLFYASISSRTGLLRLHRICLLLDDVLSAELVI